MQIIYNKQNKTKHRCPESIRSVNNEKYLDMVNGVWFYFGKFLKGLKFYMHLLFPYVIIMLSLLLAYNIRLKHDQQLIMGNHPCIKQQ